MNKPLYYTIFNIANYYNQGSILLSRELQNTGNAGLSAPMILNQSFSMELLLKFFRNCSISCGINSKHETLNKPLLGLRGYRGRAPV
nr:hypothetical protein GZ9D8_5 [uncultured archaeon GZfos9D8]